MTDGTRSKATWPRALCNCEQRRLRSWLPSARLRSPIPTLSSAQPTAAPIRSCGCSPERGSQALSGVYPSSQDTEPKAIAAHVLDTDRRPLRSHGHTGALQ